jgi:hypothetical protein
MDVDPMLQRQTAAGLDGAALRNFITLAGCGLGLSISLAVVLLLRGRFMNLHGILVPLIWVYLIALAVALLGVVRATAILIGNPELRRKKVVIPLTVLSVLLCCDIATIFWPGFLTCMR